MTASSNKIRIDQGHGFKQNNNNACQNRYDEKSQMSNHLLLQQIPYQSFNLLNQNTINKPKPRKIFPSISLFNQNIVTLATLTQIMIRQQQMEGQPQIMNCNNNINFRDRVLSTDNLKTENQNQNLQPSPRQTTKLFADLRLSQDSDQTYNSNLSQSGDSSKYGSCLGLLQINPLKTSQDVDMSYNSMKEGQMIQESRDLSISSVESLNQEFDCPLSQEERRNKVRSYWEKKKRRKSQKYVRYECRKNLAEQRFRYQGRFVKFDQLNELDPDFVYNPNQKNEQKTKPIFKVVKGMPRDRSRRSSMSRSSSQNEQNFLSDMQKQADHMNLFNSGQSDYTMCSASEQDFYGKSQATLQAPGFNMNQTIMPIKLNNNFQPQHAIYNKQVPFSNTLGGFTVQSNLLQTVASNSNMNIHQNNKNEPHKSFQDQQHDNNFYESYYERLQ
eukprot:403334652